MEKSNKWNVISTYTTREAVADGFLVTVDPEASKEAGIKYPGYMTRAVWEKYVKVPQEMVGIQNLSGRLWDVLHRCK